MKNAEPRSPDVLTDEDLIQGNFPADNLTAVDLRTLSDEQRGALRREAMRRGLSMPELLGQLADEVSRRLLAPRQQPQPAA